MQVKHSSWFAAGPEVGRALELLPDGAFKLYMFLCLNAKRDTGSISISYASAAKSLNKSRHSINTYFEKLRKCGVCIIHPAANQHASNQIEICDEFWPYTKTAKTNDPTGLASYLQRIKSLLIARACVKCSFGAADQKLATEYFSRGISVEQIERAIALGCCLKYLSWLNNTDSGSGLIVSFHYFSGNVEEICNNEFPAGYLDHAIRKMEKLESQWKTGCNSDKGSVQTS